MTCQEMKQQMSGWEVEIVATDISTEMLDKAKLGGYSQFEVQRGLPVEYLIKYFEKQDEVWRVKKEIREMVIFRELNLLTDFSLLGKFDVIFCRNVLIYFDQETKEAVLEKFSRMMPDDGLLLLGGAETVLGTTDEFKPTPNFQGIYEIARNPEVSGFLSA